MTLYNNLASFGRVKMRLEAVVLVVLAGVLAGAGAYHLVRRARWDERGADGPRAKAAALLCGAAVAGLLAWALAAVSRRSNGVSKLLAASSGVDFFVSPWF